MAVYKLLDEDFDQDYTLMAIHAPLEDYKVAYQLNASLNIRLQRMSEKQVSSFNDQLIAFHWYDEINEVSWGLVKNKLEIERPTQASGLFDNNHTLHTETVIPEYKRVDYFLKIDDQQGPYHKEQTVLQQLKNIPGVITAFICDVQELKSKNNLIFLTNA